jgi:glycosyltransferase involved in cell wall biosynthesis
MPKVSVVVPTMRIGGFDVLCNSLVSQTYKDFELVIADSLYKFRRNLVAERLTKLPFKVVHAEVSGSRFPINEFCRVANTGLMGASGELVVFVVDYTWLNPTCLAKHVKFHVEHSGFGYLGVHRYRHLPAVALTPSYGQVTVYDDTLSDRYAQNLEAGLHKESMWSIFEKELKQIDDLAVDQSLRDHKFNQRSGNTDYRGFFAKNDSFKLADVMSVGGWDEDLDGSHGYQDYALSSKLDTLLGVKWYQDTSNINEIVNPRSVLPCGKRIRSFDSNKQIWETKMARGFRE